MLNDDNDHVVNPNNSVEKKEKEDEMNKRGPYGISKREIADIFDKYDHRNFIEEVVALDKIGGIKGIAAALQTDINNGIGKNDDLEVRESLFGSNAVEEDPLPNFCFYVWETLGDLMLRILIVAGVVQISLGASPLSLHPDKDWVEGISIIVAVLIVVTVGSYTNYSKEKKFKELNDRNAAMQTYSIKRNGEIFKDLPDKILVGDLVKIGYGSNVPADGLLISTEGIIKMEESSLTGESDLIEKETIEACLKKSKEYEGRETNKHTISSPLIFSGTEVREGGGWFIALAVGSHSKKGQIQESVVQSQENDDSKTPLETKLDNIATQIGYFGMAAGVCTLIALFIRFGVTYPKSVESYENSYKEWENLGKLGPEPSDPKKTVSNTVIGIILLCVAIIVVAIPEGLPLAVTLSLAFSIKKMMNDNNLVRKMYACETMGGANYICSDKTGTLTKNEMNIFQLFNGKTSIDVSSFTSVSDENLKDENSKIRSKSINPLDYFSQEYLDLLVVSLACNLQMDIDENEEIRNESKTDLPFAKLLKKFDIALFPIQTKFKVNNAQETNRIPFSSSRKKMSTVVNHSSFPTGYRLFTKGASEIVLKSVSEYLNPNNGQKITKTDEDYEKFKEIINSYANLTLRTICVAYKDITENEANDYLSQDSQGNNIIENNGFTMVCIVGIKDTLREGVKEAIAECHKAGITVVMVTGDLKETAVAISKECGIWTLKPNEEVPEYFSMTGEEFFTAIGGIECSVCGKDIKDCEDPKTKAQALKKGVDPEKVQHHKIKDMKVFYKISKDLRVLARSRPLDKYALVLGLRTLENVVAVTGDGTNDAQALSKSDVGFAMGIAGTDVAKDAADIIILDDNFASIIKAVIWGRNIYDCIRKFIQFQLTVNLTACVLVFVTACIGSETPITAIQMLWLNMIMDSLGSLALATEPPHEEILHRKPNSRNEHIINYLMWKHIIANSILLFTILIVLYLIGHEFLPEEDPFRIAEAKIIFDCYGKWPGSPPVNDKYTVIAGSNVNWPSTQHLKITSSKLNCGLYAKEQDMNLAFLTYKSAYGNTSHMTILFNVFVFFTLFNQINSRIINDDVNIFYNISKNLYFILIVIVEMGLQAILIQFGSSAFSTCYGGLTGIQWGICIGFGSSTFLLTFIMKFVKLEIFIQSCFEKISRKNKIFDINDNLIADQEKLSNSINNIEAKKKLSKESSKKRTFMDNMRRPSKLDNKLSSKMRLPKEEV